MKKVFNIDFCELFGVKPEQNFKFKYKDGSTSKAYYKISIDNEMLYRSCPITMSNDISSHINKINNLESIIMGKTFSRDTLNLFKMIDEKYKYITKDKNGSVFIYQEKPIKEDIIWRLKGYTFVEISGLNQSLFDQILWEDDEPIYIDDYVTR